MEGVIEGERCELREGGTERGRGGMREVGNK